MRDTCYIQDYFSIDVNQKYLFLSGGHNRNCCSIGVKISRLRKQCFRFTGELGKAPAAVADSLPVPEPEPASADVDDEGEVEEMQARLEALRS